MAPANQPKPLALNWPHIMRAWPAFEMDMQLVGVDIEPLLDTRSWRWLVVRVLWDATREGTMLHAALKGDTFNAETS